MSQDEGDRRLRLQLNRRLRQQLGKKLLAMSASVKPRKGGVYRIILDGTPEYVLAVGPIPDDPHGLWHGVRVEISVLIEQKLIFNTLVLEEIGEVSQ
jgi:hypothetical protein